MQIHDNFIPADAGRICVRGYSARVVSLTGSTNTDLMQHLRAGGSAGNILVAHEQATGKGRLGREFVSGVGGIYFSFDVSLPIGNAELVRRLTPLSGVAAAGTLRELFGLDVKIKWVNDLILGGKKLCGILAESFVADDKIYAVIGIGINGTNTGFLDTATSLCEHTDAAIDANAVIGGTLERFLSRLPELGGDGIMDEYRALSCVIGERVRVHSFDGTPDYEADAVGIEDDCSLLVRTQDGERRLSSGEVSIRI